MDMTGEFRVSRPRQEVWDALNDPLVLMKCIPGCQSIERQSDTQLQGKVQSKIGPVKATFITAITLSNVDAPNSYTISGEGKGAAAGFARGSADVSLVDEGGDTLMRYTASLKVGGKLAQVGSRLLDGTTRKLANEFFVAFAKHMSD